MTHRVLPPDEWPKLAGTLLETAWPTLNPRETRIVAVEDAGQIVGCVALFPVWHLEGVWIAPERRGTVSVARRIVTAVRSLAKALGASEVLMMATTDAAARMCRRFGRATPLTCEHFAVQMEAPHGRIR